MRTIDINQQREIQLLLFPDNQPHVNIGEWGEGEEARVVCALTDSIKVLQLLQVANALDHAHAGKKELVITYLLGARYDRLMLKGDSVDLEVVADLINSCGFEQVKLLDPHSDVAVSLIHHSVVLSNQFLVDSYQEQNAVLICPDKGAVRKVEDYLKWNLNLKEVVYCEKTRDLSTGKISLTVATPEKCTGRPCVIIDDICDGGGTFMAIADQIQPAHLTLVVTHGIFSKGFTQLEQSFDQIIVSDSYRNHYDSQRVRIIPVAV